MIYVIIGFLLGAAISVILRQITELHENERELQKQKLIRLESNLHDVAWDVQRLKEKTKLIEALKGGGKNDS